MFLEFYDTDVLLMAKHAASWSQICSEPFWLDGPTRYWRPLTQYFCSMIGTLPHAHMIVFLGMYAVLGMWLVCLCRTIGVLRSLIVCAAIVSYSFEENSFCMVSDGGTNFVLIPAYLCAISMCVNENARWKENLFWFLSCVAPFCKETGLVLAMTSVVILPIKKSALVYVSAGVYLLCRSTLLYSNFDFDCVAFASKIFYICTGWTSWEVIRSIENLVTL